MPLTTCANGDSRPVCPPSKVICRECMDQISANLRAMLERMERVEREEREETRLAAKT